MHCFPLASPTEPRPHQDSHLSFPFSFNLPASGGPKGWQAARCRYEDIFVRYFKQMSHLDHPYYLLILRPVVLHFMITFDTHLLSFFFLSQNTPTHLLPSISSCTWTISLLVSSRIKAHLTLLVLGETSPPFFLFSLNVLLVSVGLDVNLYKQRRGGKFCGKTPTHVLITEYFASRRSI